MIVRRADMAQVPDDEGRAERLGPFTRLATSDAAGLAQLGVFVETLAPGARSSDRHWHEREDELVYVIAGEATVVEDDGEHVLGPGDAACWPAGVANPHCVVNRSAAPCTYLVVGVRSRHDVCHYPDAGRVLYTAGGSWRLVATDGTPIRSGKR